ncbi:MAG: hypothetical protein WBP22_00885 [Candidatus Saccharimonas sp.]
MTMLTDLGVDLVSTEPHSSMQGVLDAMRLAPSGGNVQPWDYYVLGDSADCYLNRDRTSEMDVAHRGSLVAAGAAMYNGEIAANCLTRGAWTEVLPKGPNSDHLFTIYLGREGPGDVLPSKYLAMRRRVTNRGVGVRLPFDPSVVEQLDTAVASADARLRLLTDPASVAEMAEILAASDRIRYMTPLLAEQMLAELVDDELAVGIGLGTLDLSATDLMKLRVVRKPSTLAALRNVQRAEGRRDFGEALGDNTRNRVNASSGVAIITMEGSSPADYLYGGYAVEKLLVLAGQLDIAAQPVSPVFLYSRTLAELEHQSFEYYLELAELRSRFYELAGLANTEAPILVLRLSHGVSAPARRSLRLPQDRVVHFGPRQS